ncbi:MAG TPA: NAD(P)H-binding protein [Acidobacteriaceae bacterium]|nr:NAD(P)H-binding protein [Acidobacteriaceae bacterium]
MRLFVLGATGGVGRELVSQALERHHRVTAFVRSPQKFGRAREGLTVVRGDVHDTGAIATAAANHDAVLSAIGPPGLGRSSITSDSARATVKALEAARVRRLVIVGVGMLFENSGLLGLVLRQTMLRNIANDSADMERIVKPSPLDWTIVRPPRLTNGQRTERYGVADDRLPAGAGGNATLSRADLAHFMLNEVERPAHLRRVVGIAYTKATKN